MQVFGKSLIVLGVLLAALGLAFYFFPAISRIPFLRQLGHLPGDIAVKRENFSFYFPLGTSLLLSVALSLVVYLVQRWKN